MNSDQPELTVEDGWDDFAVAQLGDRQAAGPDELQDTLNQVLYEAVASQYFGQAHKHRAHLYDIMRRIDPHTADIFDDDPEKAYDRVAQRIGVK